MQVRNRVLGTIGNEESRRRIRRWYWSTQQRTWAAGVKIRYSAKRKTVSPQHSRHLPAQLKSKQKKGVEGGGGVLGSRAGRWSATGAEEVPSSTHDLRHYEYLLRIARWQQRDANAKPLSSGPPPFPTARVLPPENAGRNGVRG